MRLCLQELHLRRGSWELACTAGFRDGVHFVSGNVGSGKTTLSMLCAGLILPESGRVMTSGISTRALSFQFPEYHVTGSTIGKEIASWGLQAETVLENAGIGAGEGDDPLTLSRGELKRLELACIFSAEPDLLILDEPFSSLDCAGKHRLCHWIEERERGITILFSHERSVLPDVDCLWEMEGGRLTSLGKTAGAIPHWKDAPHYISTALEMGADPGNISLKSVEEAVCRIRD